MNSDVTLDDEEIRALLIEAAHWHRRAQRATIAGDHDAVRYAYRMRETLARYVAARSTDLGFHEARARTIILARVLD